VESAVLRVASVAVKAAVTDATASLTETMVPLRLTASADRAPLKVPSAAANETDALLNAVERDATALIRETVSVERAVINPASTDESDGMEALLSDATALTRATISADTAVLNPETTAKVLALIVKFVFVVISSAIFSNVLNLAGAPLKMF
jgi:hypothetical protein